MVEDETGSEPIATLGLVENPLPRLGIIHLMIWMTVTAVFFWQTRMTFDTRFGDAGQRESAFPQGYLILIQMTDIVLSVVSGMAAAAVVALLQRWIRYRGRLLSEPGHWLVLGFFVVATSQFLLGLVTAIGLWDWLEVFTFDPRVQSVHVVTLAVPAIVYGFGFWQSKTSRWKIIFALLVARTLLRTSTYLTPWLINWFDSTQWISVFYGMINYVAIAISLAIIATAIVDGLRQDRRDWVHWVGVSTEGEAVATTVIWMIGVPLIV